MKAIISMYTTLFAFFCCCFLSVIIMIKLETKSTIDYRENQINSKLIPATGRQSKKLIFNHVIFSHVSFQKVEAAENSSF